MKRLATLLLAGALVALIVHPVAPVVNAPISYDGPRADGGAPAPPFPPWPEGGLLVADGFPLPPPWPPDAGGLLVADGGLPAPPFPPWPRGGLLVADGGLPAPPFPPWPEGAGSSHA